MRKSNYHVISIKGFVAQSKFEANRLWGLEITSF